MNVINTVDPDLIRKTILGIKQKKEAREMQENPIILTK